MQHLLFIGFLMFAAKLCSGQNYLLTKTNDTIFIQGELETNHENPARWTEFTANGVTYHLSEVKCIRLDNDFYYNINYRRMWKRVVQGKLNVYALNDKDTITDDRGRLRKMLHIQHAEGGKPVEYTMKNLALMVKENDSLYRLAKNKMHAGRSGKFLVVGGSVTLGVSVFTLLIEGIVAVLDSHVDNLEVFAIASATGVVAGVGGLVTGLVIKKRTKYLNLDPVYYYNAH